VPKYFYSAVTSKGEPKTGILESKDEQELSKALHDQGYILVSARLEEKQKGLKFFQKVLKIPIKEKLFFTRNLRLMIRSGVSLPRALKILASQSANQKFSDILFEIMREIEKGKKFSEALEARKETFSNIFCSMVKVGEETGKLEEVLKNLEKQMERTYELKSRVKGAMIYPAVIIVAMVGIGILMLVLVVPQLAQTFEDLGVELPLTTRMVIYAGTFATKFWYIFLAIFGVLVFLLKQGIKTDKGGKMLDKLLLKAPIISKIVKKTNTAYTARTLSSLIISGVPIVESLRIVSETLDNYFYREAITNAAKEVKKGNKLSDSLKPYSDIFSLTFSEMIAVGEETGQTSEILEKIADFSEAEVENLTRNLTSVIEPLIMIVVGIAVGFFAVSMIQPMYSMLGSL